MPHQPRSEKSGESSANQDPIPAAAQTRAPGRSTPSQDRYGSVQPPVDSGAVARPSSLTSEPGRSDDRPPATDQVMAESLLGHELAVEPDNE